MKLCGGALTGSVGSGETLFSQQSNTSQPLALALVHTTAMDGRGENHNIRTYSNNSEFIVMSYHFLSLVSMVLFSDLTLQLDLFSFSVELTSIDKLNK